MTEEQLRKAWKNVESLAGTSDYCNHDNDSQDLKDIELIGKLVEKEAERQSRKDNLVVGSKWECVAECFVQFQGEILMAKKGDLLTLFSVSNNTVCASSVVMPTDQFLICFKPKGETK